MGALSPDGFLRKKNKTTKQCRVYHAALNTFSACLCRGGAADRRLTVSVLKPALTLLCVPV